MRAEEVEPLSREEVRRIVNALDSTRDKALVAFLYLTGARISEALQVRAEDFQLKDEWLLVRLITLKKRRRKKDGYKPKPPRIVPIPLKDPLSRHVLAWVRQVGEGRLWPFTRRWALEIVKRGARRAGIRRRVWLHLLRHSRLTELVAEYDYGEFQLMRFTGWSDARPADTYIKLKWRDLAKKL